MSAFASFTKANGYRPISSRCSQKGKTVIKRRIVLTGLAAAAATPVLAQGQSTRAPGAGAAAKPEAQHILQTMAMGSLSLTLSRIAAQKASFPKLKEFAWFEIAEQETVADILKSLQTP